MVFQIHDLCRLRRKRFVHQSGIINKEVKQILDKADKPEKMKRGTYEHFTSEEKAQMGKRAAKYGVTASPRYFSKAFPGRSLKESTVKV